MGVSAHAHGVGMWCQNTIAEVSLSPGRCQPRTGAICMADALGPLLEKESPQCRAAETHTTKMGTTPWCIPKNNLSSPRQ